MFRVEDEVLLTLISPPASENVSSEAPSSDDALLARCANGDASAADRFVRRHHDVVVRFVARMLGPSDPAVDDMVQQTFLTALDSAHRFRGSSTARSWVLGIAHNKTRTHLRSRSRRHRVLRLFGREPSPTQHDAELHRRELAQRIDDAIRTLEPNRRSVFVLTEIEGVSTARAAEIAGVPEGTVRRWRFEARKALQSELADLRDGDAP